VLTAFLSLIEDRSLTVRYFNVISLSHVLVEGDRTAWMNAKLFSEWLADINSKMKKSSRQILLFLDNAPCHPVDVQLSNIKLFFFPPNTTSTVQPLDQGVIHSFKCHYCRMFVRHIIAQCTMAHSIDQITITALDAIRWIHEAWNTVTSITIRNCFRTAGFSCISTDQQTLNYDIMLIDNVDDQDSIKYLDDLLSHLPIGGNRMSAIKLVNIDSNIPVFNEWNDNSDLLVEIVNINDTENVEEDESIEEIPLKLPEALDMLRRLHLFASTEQPGLHVLISKLESEMTDLYLDSKMSKQSCITDFFKK
jgi:hypothetical protein